MRLVVIKFSYLLSITLCFFGCSSVSSNEVATTEVKDTLRTLATIANVDTLVQKDIIEIPANEFFFGDAYTVINTGQQHESSLYVPLQIVIKDDLLFIPNIARQEIWAYDYAGSKHRTIRIPEVIQGLDYFEFLDNGNLITTNFADGKLFEINERNLIENELPVDDVKFSSDGKNYLVRASTIFRDKLGLFEDNFSQSFGDNSFDYFLKGNEFFITYYEVDTLWIVRNAVNGLSEKYHFEGLPINESSKPVILSVDDAKIKILLDPVLFRQSDFQILTYDFTNQSWTLQTIKNPGSKDILIGEGAMIWGAGMVYKLVKDTLFVMYTTPKGIRVIRTQV